MITPGFNLTATERVLPRLALDFTTASLDPRVTVTRALNTATRVNSSGLIETVNANLPRFDYDPVNVGVCKGLLIEETRANALPSSNDFTNATYWVANGSPTILANQVSSPDGTTNACTMEVSGSSNGFGVYSAATFAAGTYTASLYFKPISGNLVFRLGFSTTSSTINMNTLAIVNGANSVGTVEAGPNGYYRFKVTVTTSITLSLNIYSIGSNTGKMAIYGCQVEAGSFSTSYIPTTAGSLTRNADVVSMTGTNFSDWYNPTEGAFMANVSSLGTFAFNSVIDVNNATLLNRIVIRYNSASVASGLIIDNNITQAVLNPSAPNASASKFVIAYKANSFAASYRGGAVSTATSGTVPTVTQLNIGHLIGVNTTQLNGHFIQLSYYPLRLTNNEVQAFSK